MKRRSFLLSLALLPSFAACAADELLGTLKKPRSYWKPLLPVAAYKVLFEEDTEAPGSSALLNEHGQGHFICAACYQPLFASEKKFESGTGWPSFWQPIDA